MSVILIANKGCPLTGATLLYVRPEGRIRLGVKVSYSILRYRVKRIRPEYFDSLFIIAGMCEYFSDF